MARARNIKPGFFTNDELADLPPLGRLLFIGLWTVADREGRLEDRPRRIKAEVLPYDECNVDDLLSVLEHCGFIVRYRVDEGAYIQVLNFLKHQKPHPNEAASSIVPIPDDFIPRCERLTTKVLSAQADRGMMNDDCLNDESENFVSADKPPQKTKRAAKLSADFVVDEQMRAWAEREHFTDAELDRETPKFIDHFTANGKPQIDWAAAWRNWMRRSREYAPRPSPVNGSGPRLTPQETAWRRKQDELLAIANGETG